MKLHCANILLFAFLLNILVTLYQAHNNNNEPHSTPLHTRITTSRMLSECDVQSSIYDKDEDIKSVKEIFDRQSSKRFEEYKERMKDKRQKRKEQRDKNIQKIIEEDKREKSLADKVEKGCLKCGCGLGGVAASVGIFGTVAVNVWKSGALLAATEEAITEATALATKAGIDAVKLVIEGSRRIYESQAIDRFISVVGKTNFNSESALRESTVNLFSEACKNNPGGTYDFCNIMILNSEESTFTHYVKPGIAAFQKEFASQKGTLETLKIGTVEATTTSCQTAIIASVVAIVVIVLILIIIYLILRSRRKKKVNKKAQYTKLLEE
ncbi:rifin [Plasmodium reichenowi]|uniref:Rifin n=1 Tax=Plasmodium reichenowi TaxID=5854 RepID=A0A060RM62_PLARE|nr:rifin [Plasmodium reichenowi]